MHFHFTTAEVLWTLTFAGQLVLLVVLLGRDRAARFPWFTASIVLLGLRLLTQKMLYSRLDTVTYNAVLISLIDLSAVMSLMVLVELARKALGGVRRSTWWIGTATLLAAAAVVLRYWGAWPQWKVLTQDPHLTVLRLMQLAGQKATVLTDLVSIGLGVLIVLLGRRYGAGWRSHTQQLTIGISTAALAQIGVQVLIPAIFAKVQPHSQADVDRLLALRDRIFDADNVIYIAVIVWWIACLWIDEPGTTAAVAEDPMVIDAEVVADPSVVEPEMEMPENELRES